MPRGAVRLLVEVGLAALLALVIMVAPLGWLGSLAAAARLPAAVLVSVCFLGKLLYDTFFYNRYR